MSITKKEQKVINKIQSRLSSCADCESWDEGEPLWLWGDATDIYNLLADSEIEDNRKEVIAFEFKCPNCSCELELMSKVSIKRKYELELEKHIFQSMKKYGNSLKDFEALIRDYPFLALNHTIGKKIFREVSKKKIAQTTIKADTVLYRSRLCESSKILGSNDLFNPPLGVPTEGRFNHNGQSYFYLCNEEEGSILEISENELVWTQTFKIDEEIDNILDLSFDYEEVSLSTDALLICLHLSEIFKKNSTNKGNWKPDYFITRFVMDCAKKSGYSGIKYNSIKMYSSMNYVLFDIKNKNIKPLDEPEVKKYSQKNIRDRDFSFLDSLKDI
ncbi:RES domain-containing protein [Flavobacterium sp. 1]|uniref:RES family NAD+ phosphorylase n=1 Tax=Flavobacterium sp. 1 TaxID=2035200 RepID=UPI000C2439BA|nr:RES family NAD+ phosphorylase [Flavobacterium sp. 1]PJJ10289.1 RES domain-containing protein [Flavobacterium sp. 1]